jgi:hypothetical protein
MNPLPISAALSFDQLMENLSVAFSDWRLIAVIAGTLVAIAFLAQLHAYATIFGPLGRLLGRVNPMIHEWPVANVIEEFNTRAGKRPGSKVARNFWELWEKYLRRCYQDPVSREWFSPQPAEDCFHLDALLRGTRISFYRHVPGYLLSLGLMFTFAGIALVIYRSSALMLVTTPGGGDISRQLALLLANASAKFWTSLAGLLSSIIFSILFRNSLHQLESKLGSFHEWMHGTIAADGQQHGFVRQDLGYIATLMLRAQMSQREMLTNIAIDVQKTLDGSFSKAIDKIHHIADNIGIKVGEANSKGISSLVEEISKRLGAEMESTLGRLRGAMEEATRNLEAAVSAAPAEAAKIKAVSAELEENFKSVSDELAGSANSAAAAIRTALADAGEHLGGISTMARETAENFGTAFKGLENVAGTVATLSTALGETSAGITRAEEALDKTSMRLTEASAALEASAGSLAATQADSSSALESASGKIIKSATEFAANLAMSHTASSSALESAAGTIIKSATEFTAKLAEIQGKPLTDLRSRLGEVKESSESLKQAVAQMAGGEFKNVLRALEDSSANLARAVDEQSRQPIIPSSWKTAARRFTRYFKSGKRR